MAWADLTATADNAKVDGTVKDIRNTAKVLDTLGLSICDNWGINRFVRVV